MVKRMVIMLGVVGIILVAIFGWKVFVKAMFIDPAMAKLGSQPQTVATVIAAPQTWQTTADTVGTLRAINGADLSLDIAGVVDQINFSSGDEVKAGTVLLRLRAEDDPGKLAAFQASAQLAQITYQRDLKQLQAEAVSQATVDSDAATLKSAEAQVAQQQALIEKKTLRAPFDGRLGIRAVDLGQYLAVGTTIVTLQQLDPIYVDFYLPEQTLATTQVGQNLSISVDAAPGTQFDGSIIAIDPKIDSGSRNVQIRGKLANAAHRLVPGMFAKVSVQEGAPQSFITLPASAIAFNAYGATVFLVEDHGKDADGQPLLTARQTFVTTGQTRGDQVAVLKGVKDKDVVVTTGQIKLRNGSRVVVNNTVLPSADANPSTPDN